MRRKPWSLKHPETDSPPAYFHSEGSNSIGRPTSLCWIRGQEDQFIHKRRPQSRERWAATGDGDGLTGAGGMKNAWTYGIP